MTSKFYRLGGLVFDSELPLPGLPEVKAQPGDVRIRFGTTPSTLEDAREIEPGCLANDHEFLQTVSGVATFYLRGGDEIVIYLIDSERLNELRSYLHSAIFAVLFFRRGLLPLHASSVEVHGRVFGFMGRSGAGKSSLAAHLRRRGYRVIADDLTLLNRTRDGVTQVTPCAPWLKLWQDALDGLAQPVRGLELIAGKDSKYRVPLTATDSQEELPLAGLFLLESSSEGDVRISPLAPAAAIAKLMLYVYPVLLIHRLGQDAELFRQCGEILGRVPMWSFSRPWDQGTFDRALDRLEQHFGGVGSESAG